MSLMNDKKSLCLSLSAGRAPSRDQALLQGPAMGQEAKTESDAQEVSPEHEEELSCALTKH